MGRIKSLLERNWKKTIDVKDVWNKLKEVIGNDSNYSDDSEELQKVFEIFIRTLKRYSFIPEELINDLEGTYTKGDGLEVEEFNSAWDDLYNWADDNDIWVKTTF